MSSADTHGGKDLLEQAYPPLDIVGSRWWYWIVAYLVVSVLFVPIVIIAALAFVTPAVVVGPGEPTVGVPLQVLVLVFTLLIFGFAILSLAVFVMLPVALYMDARQVARANIDWEPDPVLYAILALLKSFNPDKN